jgi:uncharacterized protein (TIGR02996 family)
MATDEAFVRGILDNPEDDSLRLVYADWLEERGDPRGEFIRVQCCLAGMAPDDPRHAGLESREWELLTEHGGRWVDCPGVKTLPALAEARGEQALLVTFRGGFPYSLTGPAAVWVAHGEALLKLETVRVVQMVGAARLERREGESAADFKARCDVTAAGRVLAAMLPTLAGAFQPLADAMRQAGEGLGELVRRLSR